jgi:hypothetical protein
MSAAMMLDLEGAECRIEDVATVHFPCTDPHTHALPVGRGSRWNMQI